MKSRKTKLSEFEMAVLDAIKKIPRGRLTTYARVARAVGRPRAYRAVGNALNKNPWAPVVPCHRVVQSDGWIGGYGGGQARKIHLLIQEGIEIKQGRIVDPGKYLVYL